MKKFLGGTTVKTSKYYTAHFRLQETTPHDGYVDARDN